MKWVDLYKYLLHRSLQKGTRMEIMRMGMKMEMGMRMEQRLLIMSLLLIHLPR